MSKMDRSRVSQRSSVIYVALLALGGLSGTVLCGPGAAAQEKPIVREKNPPGDIPDDQVFIPYTSPQGFSLKVPEGWARKDAPDGVTFADKYGRIDIAVTAGGVVPTAASVRTGEALALEQSGRAVKVVSIKDVTLPAGPAVHVVYTSNSEPNAVTNKQLRLENERYLVARAGRIVALTFSAPAGADNADQWQLMSRSFRWN